MSGELHDHDLGLSADLSTLVNRRLALGLFAGAGLATVVGCADTTGVAATGTPTAAGPANQPTSGGSQDTATVDASCTEIPEETAGPFPGDGSNGPNALSESGIVRSDIRSSFGSASGVAEGVPLTIKLTILDSGGGCAALSGAAVYLWHCDNNGDYSMYSQEVTNENFLRGVQAADSEGAVTFRSAFPGCYPGRWPHIHFEVYPSLDAATSADHEIKTSQLAFPQDVCEEVYATDGYATSARNLSQTSLATDSVFRDGYDAQLAAVTGDITSGFVATLAVTV